MTEAGREARPGGQIDASGLAPFRLGVQRLGDDGMRITRRARRTFGQLALPGGLLLFAVFIDAGFGTDHLLRCHSDQCDESSRTLLLFETPRGSFRPEDVEDVTRIEWSCKRWSSSGRGGSGLKVTQTCRATALDLVDEPTQYLSEVFTVSDTQLLRAWLDGTRDEPLSIVHRSPGHLVALLILGLAVLFAAAPAIGDERVELDRSRGTFHSSRRPPTSADLRRVREVRLDDAEGGVRAYLVFPEGPAPVLEFPLPEADARRVAWTVASFLGVDAPTVDDGPEEPGTPPVPAEAPDDG